MEESLILETSFLIDLEREFAATSPGPAQDFLEVHPDVRLHITFTIAGELAAGTSMRERDLWERFLAPFEVLAWTREVSWQYGQLYRYLNGQGMLIGANDLWIAATAIAHATPVVTHNVRQFGRVPGLDLRTYR